MSEDTTTTEETPPKKAKPKKLQVTVLRAVDGYHHRNAKLTVPDDDYHRGLVRIGNLRIERED